MAYGGDVNRREFNRLAMAAAAAGVAAPWISAAGLPAAGTTAAASHQPYPAKFARLWPEVHAYVQHEWKSLVSHSSELPKPFMGEAPGWNFMFYWDNYFMNLGLLRLPGYEQYAKNATDNLCALVEQLGFVPNCNLSWGRNRSQPPYLSQIVREVYATLPDKQWLGECYRGVRKEYAFWMDEAKEPLERHSTPVGLQRFSHHASREEMIVFYRDGLVSRFGYPKDVSDDEKVREAEPYVVEAASGMDFTPRFEHRSHQFAAVDLNVLLYMCELNLDWMTHELGMKAERDWKALAAGRAELIQKYCWDEARGFYFDYDFVNQRRGKVACCTGFMPMWAGMTTRKQNKQMTAALKLFEYDWGLACCERTEQARHYQWDYPNGWVPLHALAILAFEKAGEREHAMRIAAKYCDLIARNYDVPTPASYMADGKTHERARGRMYEKYEVTTGNIADTEYPAFEGLSWTAGVFIFAHELCTRG